MTRSSYRMTARRGGLAGPALIALPVVLLAFVIGMSSRMYNEIHIRLQIEADAGVLAGGDALLGDALLRGRLQGGANNVELYNLLLASRQEIRDYAQANPVYGGYSTPDWNPAVPEMGDIKFGKYDRLLTTPFTPVVIVDGSNNPTNNLHEINAIRVTMRRTHATNDPIKIPRLPIIGKGRVDAFTHATVLLDGDIHGFRPLFPTRPIPLMPVALKSSEVEAQSLVPYTDNLAYDPNTGSYVAGNDSLPELTFYLTTATPPMGISTTAVSLTIGTADFSEFQTQIGTGVYASQLANAPFNGAFLLQPDAPNVKLAVPGEEFFDTANGNDYATALSQWTALPLATRLWPIYSEVDGMGQPVVIGFMAARLIAVEPIMNGMNVEAIKLTLQPTLTSEPSAVTNTAYRGYVGIPNQTIAKIRLVP